MRKLFAAIFALIVVAAPMGAAFANEAIHIENADFADTYSDGIPTGWYAEAWYDEGGEYEIETVQKDGETGQRIKSAIENKARIMTVEEFSAYLF